MTVRELLWYECKICKKTFLSYSYGQYLRGCYNSHDGGICFYDNTLGEIHENSYLNAIEDKRKCIRCNKSNQLEEFII